MFFKMEPIKQYLAVPWIKYFVWSVLIIGGIFLIAVISNYLTVIVFNIK